jgi:AraC-like DNA-binding protein
MRSKKEHSLRKQEKEALQKLKTKIGQNPGGSYKISELSADLSMDRNKLYYGFKKVCSRTIHQFIISQRIKLAKRLLRNTEKPIKAIASDCGYKDVKNFHTAFKKATRTTPLAYRTNK